MAILYPQVDCNISKFSIIYCEYLECLSLLHNSIFSQYMLYFWVLANLKIESIEISYEYPPFVPSAFYKKYLFLCLSVSICACPPLILEGVYLRLNFFLHCHATIITPCPPPPLPARWETLKICVFRYFCGKSLAGLEHQRSSVSISDLLYRAIFSVLANFQSICALKWETLKYRCFCGSFC